MDPKIIEENQAARDELRALLERLTDQDLDREVSNGWTVATILSHLAFWDLLCLNRLKEWQRGGVDPTQLTGQQVNTINLSVRTLSRSLTGRDAAQLALDSAEAADSQVQVLRPELAVQIEAAGFERVLKRHLHRREHLAKIKQALP